ncbi:YcjF family protein [Thermosynechococcus sp. M55_K2018_012]|uniref:YcjF family protein n=1 Tax=Thermosynechococcus sp. M55_K2018_012 TaxID=2747809 RepID=UPI0019DFDB1F|nr:YcjF family protein [Thermosynechococcus sp. M55_K2018_012]HIK48156.1 YcjF family protein [Thermosynechococcus sp. M55_K2018_012]
MAVTAAIILLLLSGWVNDHPWGWPLILGLGLGYWYWRRRSPAAPNVSPPQPSLHPQLLEKQLADTQNLLQELPMERQASLQSTHSQLQQRLDSPTVEVCVLGQSAYALNRVYDAVATLPLDSCTLQQQTLATVPQADLVLLTVTGALTASEFEMLRVLQASHYHVLVVWYPEMGQGGDRPKGALCERVALHLQQQLQQLQIGQDQLIPFTPHNPQALTSALLHCLTQKRANLVLAGTYRRAQQLHQQAQAALNQYRQERAIPIIERYQWLAAAATAVNPLPLLDLVMAGGLLVRLTWDLGQIYQRSFRLADAEPLAKELLRLIVQLGAVELGTQSLGQWLKGNSLTYLAGSCLQGATAAYVLRLSGLSLIHYFETAPQTKALPLVARLQQSLQWAQQQVGRSPLQTLGHSLGLPSA